MSRLRTTISAASHALHGQSGRNATSENSSMSVASFGSLVKRTPVDGPALSNEIHGQSRQKPKSSEWVPLAARSNKVQERKEVLSHSAYGGQTLCSLS